MRMCKLFYCDDTKVFKALKTYSITVAQKHRTPLVAEAR